MEREPMGLEDIRRHAAERRRLCEQIKDVLVKRLDLPIDPNWITDDQPLFGRGLELDSVDALEVAVAIDEIAEVSVTDEQVDLFGSINRIVDYIQEQAEATSVREQEALA